MFRHTLLTATALAAGAFAVAHADPRIGAATLPAARSGNVGDTLTAFGVMANGGDMAATDCAPAVTGFQGSFSYRAVDPDNQTFSAPQDTPVDIGPGEARNFILALTPIIPLTERSIDLRFDCSNSEPAPAIEGVNSILLTARTAPGPDILPVIVTPSGDGVIRIAGQNRAQAAAIAAANIGAGGDVDVIVTADMTLLGEPLSLGLCQTGSDGRCVDEFGNPAQTPPPAGQTTINAEIGNSAATFSVFAFADRGAGVRFNPDLSRVQVRFYERAQPPLAPSELASVSLAERPGLASAELSGVSTAATAPGRPPIAGEALPIGIFEAVFETQGERGEGVLIAGPEGQIAGGFDLVETDPPFGDVPLAVFGMAAPAAAGRIRADAARLYGLSSDTPAVSYTLRGPFEPDHFIEGSLDPVAAPDQPRILFRGQYDGLSSQTIARSSLSGPHQIIANGVPLGFANFTNGAFDGFLSDGDGSMDANCLVTGAFAHADPQSQANLFTTSVTFTTATGQTACALAATASGLGFRSDRPRHERGAMTRNVLSAFLEEPNQLAAVNAQFRPILGTGFQVRRVASGLTQALFVTGLPDASGRILVVRKTGQVHIVNPLTGLLDPDLFLDVSSSISTDGEGGLVGLALAPDFQASGTFYVNVANPAGDTEIRRYTTRNTDRDQADPASMNVILGYAQPQAFHNGGWLGFGPDGFLYIASGDGGGVGDPNANAQNPNTLLGAILRIDPSSDDYPADAGRDYAIPAGNPYAAAGGAPEVWATGLRNPFRSSFDPRTGDLYVADVGQGAVEEIDIIPAGQGGLNFGWPLREGTRAYNGGADSAAFTGPVADYGHGTGPYQGNSVTGGYVYRGDITALDGHYVFADFVQGNIWSIPVEYLDPDNPVPAPGLIHRNQDFTPDAGEIGNVSSFGTDADGALYIVDYDGEIFRIEAAQ